MSYFQRKMRNFSSFAFAPTKTQATCLSTGSFNREILRMLPLRTLRVEIVTLLLLNVSDPTRFNLRPLSGGYNLKTFGLRQKNEPSTFQVTTFYISHFTPILRDGICSQVFVLRLVVLLTCILAVQ